MGPSLKPLAAQRLLLAALLGVMAISAVLLFGLRSGSERRSGRGARADASKPASAELQATATEAAPLAGEAPATPFERTASAPAAPEASHVTEEFDPGALTGRILALGEPVADVEVRVYPAALERRERTTPLAEAKSDAEGRFRIAGLEPHRRLSVCLQHPGFEPDEHSLFPGHDEELELEPSATVRGRVRAASGGTPLAGVQVALECWHAGEGRFPALVASTSDAEGRWELPWATPGIERFLVLRPGHLPEVREFQVSLEGAGEYEILLGAEEVVTLELFLLEDGTALADTEVLNDDVRLLTDARGTLTLPLSRSVLSEGGVRIALALEGGPQTQGRIDLGLEPRPTVLRLPLSRGGRVSGRVLDAEGGPIEGALVRLTAGGRLPPGLGFPPGFGLNPPRGGARSGSDGRYLLAGLAPRESPVQVRADHPDHPFGRSEPFEFARLGATAEADVRLELGAEIAGEVRVDGQPASARVYWSSERGDGWTRSNDRGAYRLRGLPSGELGVHPRLEDEDEDVARVEDRRVFVEDGARLTLDFELDGGRQWIRGRVLDSLGAAVAGAEVLATPSEDEAFAQNDNEWMSVEVSTESGADGTFELAVPERTGLVLDVSAHSGPARATVTGVRPGGPELELVLPALAPVVLRVVDALHHEPVLGFQLYWRTAEEGRFERLSQGGRRFSPGPDGTFVAELPLGRLDLAVSARSQGFAFARREGVLVANAPAAPLEFELERGVELVLEILAPPENPGLVQQLQRARTAIATEEQWSGRERDGDFFHQEVRSGQALRPGPDGTVHLSGLASGRYRFLNVPKGLVFRPKTFELPPVANHRQSVTLEPEPEKKPRPRED